MPRAICARVISLGPHSLDLIASWALFHVVFTIFHAFHNTKACHNTRPIKQSVELLLCHVPFVHTFFYDNQAICLNIRSLHDCCEVWRGSNAASEVSAVFRLWNKILYHIIFMLQVKYHLHFACGIKSQNRMVLMRQGEAQIQQFQQQAQAQIHSLMHIYAESPFLMLDVSYHLSNLTVICLLKSVANSRLIMHKCAFIQFDR
jgi:hypothetical protein